MAPVQTTDTTMILPYTKMSGAGNTFIVLEERCLPESSDLAALVPNFCDDHHEHGGADGVIAIGASGDGADFAMRYFNRDGSTGMMCGNGGRCAVRFAYDHEYVRNPTSIAFTNAGVRYRAAMTERGVRVWFPDPRSITIGIPFDLDGDEYRCHYADVGTPHVIMIVDESGDPSLKSVDDVDIVTMGPQLRHHRRFAPDGANANFVELASGSAIRLRTYERGVEAETGACGTGAIASALIAAIARGIAPPIDVTTTSGDVLRVDFRLDGAYATGISLEGGADVVMEGEFGLAW